MSIESASAERVLCCIGTTTSPDAVVTPLCITNMYTIIRVWQRFGLPGLTFALDGGRGSV